MDVDSKANNASGRLLWTRTPRRILPEDEFFAAGDLLCQQLLNKHSCITDDGNFSEDIADSGRSFTCQQFRCQEKFSSTLTYEMHYNTFHRNVCSVCQRCFTTPHLLELHILELHDVLFQLQSSKKSMYRCLVESCTDVFMTSRQRRDHAIRVHMFPSNFRFSSRNEDAEKHDSRKEVKLKKTHSANNMNDVTVPVTAQVSSQKAVSLDVSSTGPILPESGHDEEMIDVSEEVFDAAVDKPVPINNSPVIIQPARRFAYKVPQNICFGQGASRGFHRPPGRGSRRGRHWHQDGRSGTDTLVNIQDIQMSDLFKALG